MLKVAEVHPDFQSPITLFLDSHIPLKELRAFVQKNAGAWKDKALPLACFGDGQTGATLIYDHDLKAVHFWVTGSNGKLSMSLLYDLQGQLFEAFPLAFESKAVVEVDGVYAVLSDEGCRCELEAIASIITQKLKNYPGYMPDCLNVVAEQAAEQFGGYVVRQARRETYDPYVVY